MSKESDPERKEKDKGSLKNYWEAGTSKVQTIYRSQQTRLKRLTGFHSIAC